MLRSREMEMRMEIEMDGKQRAAEAIVALSGPGRALNSLPTPQGKCPASYTSCITADTYQNAGATMVAKCRNPRPALMSPQKCPPNMTHTQHLRKSKANIVRVPYARKTRWHTHTRQKTN